LLSIPCTVRVITADQRKARHALPYSIFDLDGTLADSIP
jgi:hypothetical protein